MEMQQPPKLDFNYPNGAMVASDLFRQEQEKARKEILNNLSEQTRIKDSEQGVTSQKSAQETQESPQSLSSLYRQAREQKKKLKNSGLGQEALEMATAPIRQATSKLLQQYWFNLIDTWGATLILINVHWFLNITMGNKFFCDLGSEWLPEVGKEAGAVGGQAAESILGMPTAGLGLLEKMLVIILDLMVAALIFLCIVPIILAIYILSDPTGALFNDFSLFLDGVKALLNI